MKKSPARSASALAQAPAKKAPAKKAPAKKAPAKKAPARKAASRKRAADAKRPADVRANEISPSAHRTNPADSRADLAGEPVVQPVAAGAYGVVRVGIGGWTFEPWRGVFYPRGLPQHRELAFASERLTAIEINGTYYRTQSRDSFVKWHDETPDGFMFSVKANRFTTQQRDLGAAGESVERFLGSGITALGSKLGPILWQLPATKRFDARELASFFKLLPAERDGVRLRHALDVRHPSFLHADYVALAREYRVTTVFTDSDDYPPIADLTGDFVYARLMRTEPQEPTGYRPSVLGDWHARALSWRAGGDPDDLPHVTAASRQRRAPCDVFIFFIAGAKERAPGAARALLAQLSAGDRNR